MGWLVRRGAPLQLAPFPADVGAQNLAVFLQDAVPRFLDGDGLVPLSALTVRETLQNAPRCDSPRLVDGAAQILGRSGMPAFGEVCCCFLGVLILAPSMGCLSVFAQTRDPSGSCLESDWC